ncbi:MAG: hypothetical protein ACK4I8_11745 [Armatimonadota bacterium]
MVHQTEKWQKALKEFASVYLLPAAGVFVLVIVGLGVLGIAGWMLRHIAIPVFAVLLLLAVVALLTAEMVWRLATFNALVGIGTTFYAVVALTRDAFPTIVGVALGVLSAIVLHLYGDTMKASEKEKKTFTDAKGRPYKVVLLSGDNPDAGMLASAGAGLLIPLLCWGFREHGTWSLFLGLYASLALGRAISWISVESDTQTIYLWRPFPFLNRVPGFSHFFQWWREFRQILGIGIAHWARGNDEK